MEDLFMGFPALDDILGPLEMFLELPLSHGKPENQRTQCQCLRDHLDPDSITT
jgi:hypothetical protein